MIGRQIADAKAVQGAQLVSGVFRLANTDGTVVVDFGAGDVICLSSGVYWPAPGETVRVLRVGSQSIVIGPAVPRPTYGVVVDIAGNLVTVDFGAGRQETMPHLSTYTPTLSDEVLILRGSMPAVVGELSDIVNPDPPPANSNESKTRTVTFSATSSGTQNAGESNYWSDDVWCGNTSVGAWFYGDTIARTIPDNATGMSGRIYLPEFYNAYPNAKATLGTHRLKKRSGVLTVTGSQAVSKGSGWKPLQSSFLARLRDGDAYGIATNHGGLHKFTSRARNKQSGQIQITFTVGS